MSSGVLDGDSGMTIPKSGTLPVRVLLPNIAQCRRRRSHSGPRLLRHKKECDIEKVLKEYASHNGTQVFLEIDRLRRTCELRLIYKKDGDYALFFLKLRRDEGRAGRQKTPLPTAGLNEPDEAVR